MPKLLKLKRAPHSDVLPLYVEIFSGDPARAMQAAKRLITHSPEAVSSDVLARVLLDPKYREWSRVASAYVLGFLPPSSAARHALRTTLLDSTNKPRLRGHAAEALGNLQDPAAVAWLSKTLNNDAEATSLRKWCIYALSEIASAESRKALDAFARTRPSGVLHTELQSVCEPCLA